MQRLTNLFIYLYSRIKLLVGGDMGINRKFPLQIVLGRNCRFKGKGIIDISKGFVLRDNCRLEAGSNGSIYIGMGCFLNNNVCITAMGHLEIGNNVTIGNNVVIVDHNHNYKQKGNEMFITTPVKISDDVWIGANVTILPGTIIERGSVIGAGSVIKGHIPSNVVVYNERKNIVKEKL